MQPRMETAAEFKPGDRWVAELPDRALVLIASYNLYGRWTITIYDQKSQSNLFELHDEQTLEGARKYAEGYVNGAFHQELGPFQWKFALEQLERLSAATGCVSAHLHSSRP